MKESIFHQDTCLMLQLYVRMKIVCGPSVGVGIYLETDVTIIEQHVCDLSSSFIPSHLAYGNKKGGHPLPSGVIIRIIFTKKAFLIKKSYIFVMLAIWTSYNYPAGTKILKARITHTLLRHIAKHSLCIPGMRYILIITANPSLAPQPIWIKVYPSTCSRTYPRYMVYPTYL